MADVGNNRPRTESRKKPRRQFHYTAKIIAGDNSPPIVCSIADISDLGARLCLKRETQLPETFWLLLTANGGARRQCRTIWRDGLIIGVAFPQENA
jgi:hypothetical protein